MEFMDRAKAIFERFVGYRIEEDIYIEETRCVDNNTPLLKISPVQEIISVKAKAKHLHSRFFGSTDWVNIDHGHFVIHKQEDKVAISLPPTLFGTEYSQAIVTYKAGLKIVPDDVTTALNEIASLLENGSITEWNCMLPVSVLDVIHRYRKEDN